MTILAYWKWIAAAALLATIFYGGAHWQSGRDQRTAQSIAGQQAKRDGASAIALAEANERAITAEHEAQGLNRRITDELQPKLDAADANGLRLARLLRNAILAGASGGNVPQAPDQPGAVEASGKPAGNPTLDDAVAAVIGSCQRDALRLDALIAEIKPQL